MCIKNFIHILILLVVRKSVSKVMPSNQQQAFLLNTKATVPVSCYKSKQHQTQLSNSIQDKSTLYLKAMKSLTSLAVSLQGMAPASFPQQSEISETFSRLRTVAICVRRANLSRTDQDVALLRYDTSDLTSLSRASPPSQAQAFNK